MKSLLVIFSFFIFTLLLCNVNANAQVVAQSYGVQFTQQQADAFMHFVSLASNGRTFTSQEKVMMQPYVINIFYGNPQQTATLANTMLAAKNDPYQSAMIVGFLQQSMQQQQMVNQYPQYGIQYPQYQQYQQPAQPNWQQMQDYSRQMHGTSMDIINNIGH